MEENGQLHALAILALAAHWIRGWVDPELGWMLCGKKIFLFILGIKP
jgi:hypothetical protein